MSRRQLMHQLQQLQLQSSATSEDVWYIWWSLVVPDQSASQSGSPRGQEGVLVRVPHDCSYTWLLRLLNYGFVMRNFSLCVWVCVFLIGFPSEKSWRLNFISTSIVVVAVASGGVVVVAAGVASCTEAITTDNQSGLDCMWPLRMGKYEIRT